MLSVPGAGEMPISISSSPSRPEVLELCVRRVGRVTNALYRLRTNDVVGVRGPYGNGYPMPEMQGNDLLLAAGGLGMAPLRSLLWYALDHRDKFDNITLMYGTKRPEDMLFREELLALVDRTDINCLLTVDADPSGTWKNHVGLLPTLFDHAKIDPLRTYAAVCGPPVVYKFILQRLLELGFPKNRILMSLERRMKCGIGKCGHCSIGYKYTCLQGPDFHLLGRHQPAGDDLMSKPTVGIFGLTGCAGDQLVILNCEDQLLDLVSLIDDPRFSHGLFGESIRIARSMSPWWRARCSANRDAETLARHSPARQDCWWRWEPARCGAAWRPWTAARWRWRPRGAARGGLRPGRTALTIPFRRRRCTKW